MWHELDCDAFLLEVFDRNFKSRVNQAIDRLRKAVELENPTIKDEIAAVEAFAPKPNHRLLNAWKSLGVPATIDGLRTQHIIALNKAEDLRLAEIERLQTEARRAKEEQEKAIKQAEEQKLQAALAQTKLINQQYHDFQLKSVLTITKKHVLAYLNKDKNKDKDKTELKAVKIAVTDALDKAHEYLNERPKTAKDRCAVVSAMGDVAATFDCLNRFILGDSFAYFEGNLADTDTKAEKQAKLATAIDRRAEIDPRNASSLQKWCNNKNLGRHASYPTCQDAKEFYLKFSERAWFVKEIGNDLTLKQLKQYGDQIIQVISTELAAVRQICAPAPASASAPGLIGAGSGSAEMQ